MQLKLKTDYSKTGNSNDEQISTLAIALTGEDFNDLLENNYDYAHESINYVIDNFDYESHFIDSLSKAKKAKFAKQIKQDKLGDYNLALTEFTEAQKTAAYERDSKIPDLQKEIQEAEDAEMDTFYKEWLNGDYSGNFKGILYEARKAYQVEFHYDTMADILTISNYEERIAELIEDGEIETPNQFKQYLEDLIFQNACYKNEQEKIKQAERRAEYQKTREYQEKRKKEQAEEEKKSRLKLLNNRK